VAISNHPIAIQEAIIVVFFIGKKLWIGVWGGEASSRGYTESHGIFIQKVVKMPLGNSGTPEKRCIPNGNWFSVFYGHRFGTGFIFLLSGAYRQ
jgi:hypothetical protein